MAGDSLIDQADGSSLVDQLPTRGIVYLMRHGRTALDVEHRSDGWLDLPLSDEGQLELIESQQTLKLVPITKIYTDSLKRTTGSADLMKSGIISDPKLIVDDAMKTWNLGILAGTKKRYGRPEVERLITETPTVAPAGGEAYNAFTARLRPFLEKRFREAEKAGGAVLLITSGSILRYVGRQFFGNPDEIDLEEGGLAAVSCANGEWNAKVILGHEDDEQDVSA